MVNSRPMRQQVFECVRAAGSIPRVDVARDLEISAGSVTALTAELIRAGLICETNTTSRDADSTRGRPPVALGVCHGAGHVAGIKLSEQGHTAVILDFAGNKIADATIRSSANLLSTAEILDEAETVLLKVLGKVKLPIQGLKSVGLGLPGVVDNSSGIVLWSPLIEARNFPMRDALCNRIGVPICIDNDANLVTLAELWFGAGRTLSDFAVITIEQGVGMGLVLNHRLYRGAMGLGMELGHTKVQLDGALCRCGQRGCLEAYIAGYALVREASTALNWGSNDDISSQSLLEKLHVQAREGHAASLAVFDRAGRYLALGLANVVNLFDPSLILLSGEKMRFDFLYAEEFLTELTTMCLQTGRPPPRVEIQTWGDLLWAQGAAVLALDSATNTILGMDA
ncbi:MAG: ROK family protein [Paracoccaceae bacterium]